MLDNFLVEFPSGNPTKPALLLVKMLNTHKTVLLATICMLLIGTTLNGQDRREWVDSTGKFKINGTFQKLENDSVFLERTDGATIKIPLSSLSTQDQEFVAELIQPKEAEADTNSETNNLPAIDSPPTVEGSTSKPIERAISIEPPENEFDFLGSNQPAFESAIDINQVEQLPEDVRGLAMVLHKRPTPIEVGQAFVALSQLESLPAVTIRLLRETTQADNKYYRVQALKLLAIFDPVESFDRILDCLDDRSFSVRITALEMIQHLQDERAVESLIARFPGRERNKISTVLVSFGPKVEEQVFTLLEHKNRTVVADTIRLLEKIGTEKSIDAISPLLDSRITIRMQAESSLEKIKKRLNLQK